MEQTEETAPQSLMSQDEAASALVSYIFSGVIGSAKGKGVAYSLLEATNTTFSWIAALEAEENEGEPIDRYHVRIERESRKIQRPTLISLSEREIKDAIFEATGNHVKSFSRFTDGALSISYRVCIEEDPQLEYVLQLRHHGDVTSMNLLMSLISSSVDSSVLPFRPYTPSRTRSNGRRPLVWVDKSHG